MLCLSFPFLSPTWLHLWALCHVKLAPREPPPRRGSAGSHVFDKIRHVRKKEHRTSFEGGSISGPNNHRAHLFPLKSRRCSDGYLDRASVRCLQSRWRRVDLLVKVRRPFSADLFLFQPQQQRTMQMRLPQLRDPSPPSQEASPAPFLTPAFGAVGNVRISAFCPEISRRLGPPRR